jgi:FixJ family two-component response regulator
MANDRRGGPGGMSADELTAFLATQPSGAVCVIDDDGRLLALPARVLERDGAAFRVEVVRSELISLFERERRGCVVADSFESYDAIRGVMVQGRAASGDARAPNTVVAVTATRVATFSFATVRRDPKST